MSSSFFAYPAHPKEVADTIRSALQTLKDDFRVESVHGWEQNDIAGHFLIDPVLAEIDTCDFLAADVTGVNFNVAYEIGFAIGRRRRIFLVKNSAITADDSLVREVGIFDTVGYKQYQQSRQLASMLQSVSDFKPIPLASTEINRNAPIYLVLPKTKTDFEIHLQSRIKKARLRFRSFDPDEQVRLSASQAISNVVASYGVIVPLISNARKDSQVHNIRAAFVAGLAQGFEKELLLLQFGDDPVPLDYRDLVWHATMANQIDEAISEFAPSITGFLQADSGRVVAEPKTFLAKLNLGATKAEDEIGNLSEYYLETDEYRRVVRGEVQVVAGRKGSGKSALFFQVRDKARAFRQNIVLDLRPEGFQLRKFKDVVLAYLEQGTKEHTITAFWEYLLLLEICHKILENDKGHYRNNSNLFQAYRAMADAYHIDEYVSEGDFAERMLKLTEKIMVSFQGVLGSKKAGTRLSQSELTNLLYIHDTLGLRAKIGDYLDTKRGVWILIDNLDKGWPPKGLDEEDILILRCLIESIYKLRKYLRPKEIQCNGVVFLRNDVYELLVENTTDRGKTNRVTLDWTDPELLRELLRRRMVSNNLPEDSQFETLWHQICVSHVGTEESSAYLIERSLMRPRSLIDLVYQCRSHAVNLNHNRIERDDILEGEKAYSNDLVENIGLEMRDVYPEIVPDVKDVLYEFVGSAVRRSESEIKTLLAKYGIAEPLQPQLLDLLLWWGVLGIVRSNGEIAYIYSVQYNMNHLRALVRQSVGDPVYYLNPAIWAGLEILQ